MKRIALLFLITISFHKVSKAQQAGSGYALGFNGSSNYIDAGKVNLGTSDFTSECWFKLTDASVTRGIMGSWVSTPLPWPAYFYFIYGLLAPNKLTVAFHTAGNQFNSYASYAVSPLNEWHHVAATFNRSGKMILYFDGVARDSVDISLYNGATIDNPNPNVPLFIGAVGGGVGTPNSNFKGDIDEVRIWSKALSATEIRQNMCKRLVGTEPNLKAYWRLDEGAGTTVFDSSASGYNGNAY